MVGVCVLCAQRDEYYLVGLMVLVILTRKGYIKLVLMIQPSEYHNTSRISLYYKLHWSIIPSVNECKLYKPIISYTL